MQHQRHALLSLVMTNIILNGVVLFIIPEYVGNPVLGVAVVTASVVYWDVF